jgi:hypothetical protein
MGFVFLIDYSLLFQVSFRVVTLYLQRLVSVSNLYLHRAGGLKQRYTVRLIR